MSEELEEDETDCEEYTGWRRKIRHKEYQQIRRLKKDKTEERGGLWFNESSLRIPYKTKNYSPIGFPLEKTIESFHPWTDWFKKIHFDLIQLESDFPFDGNKAPQKKHPAKLQVIQ